MAEDISIWEKKETEYLITFIFQHSSVISLQIMMLLDNIHDFGKERGKDVGGKGRIVSIITDQINKKLLDLNYDRGNNFVEEMFNYPAWEVEIMKILVKHNFLDVMEGDILKAKISESKCWVRDTINKDEANYLLGFPDIGSYLVTSYFDACQGTCTDFKTATDRIDRDIKISVPIPSGKYTNDVITYKYDNTTKKLERRFPRKYGKGSDYSETKEKTCTCNKSTKSCDTENKCPWKRFDILSLPDFNYDETVQDSIPDILTDLRHYLWFLREKSPVTHSSPYNPEPDLSDIDTDDPEKRMKEIRRRKKTVYSEPESKQPILFDDLEFFLTLKSIGDIAQCAEAKLRNCFLVTQDVMQLILGAKIGTSILHYDRNIRRFIVSKKTTGEIILSIKNLLENHGLKFPTTEKELKKLERRINKKCLLEGGVTLCKKLNAIFWYLNGKIDDILDFTYYY